MKKSVIVIALGAVLFMAAACGSKTEGNPSVPTGKVIKTVPVGNLTATLSNASGVLKRGNQELTISFTDASGKLVDVGAMSLNFHMDQMGTMAAIAAVMRTQAFFRARPRAVPVCTRAESPRRR